MRVLLKLSCCLLLFFLLGACAKNTKIAPMVAAITTVDQAVAAFGPPSRVNDMSASEKLYIWSRTYTEIRGGYAEYMLSQVPAATFGVYDGGARIFSGVGVGPVWLYSDNYIPEYAVHKGCEFRLIANLDGIIQSSAYQGDQCDKLVLNSSVPSVLATNKNAKPYLDDCLQQAAQNALSIKKEYSLEMLTAEIENICEKETNVAVPGMSAFYAKQALE